MAPVLPSSTNNISLTPRSFFITKQNKCVTRCSNARKFNKQTLLAQKYILPLSTSVRLFPQLQIACCFQSKLRTHIVSATGTDVALEAADLAAVDNEASEISIDTANISGESSVKADVNPAPAQSKRSKPIRKSEMPPVKNEELIPGATFTGKVRSIQPFGAFVDFGAFTDGLVHVSNLSSSFVKDVGSVVSVGQEVTVRLIEANMETGRISLTMRESDDASKKDGNDKSRPAKKFGQKSNQRRDEVKKSSKFVKGQNLEGTVKNLTRAGAFISLPEGEEGFLPVSEEADDSFANVMGETSLEVGQEVSVKVLRITRGQVTLTMKKEEAAAELDSKLSQGIVHTATNPFLLAFRSNKDISAFLDEIEKEDEPVEKTQEDVEGADSEAITMDGIVPETSDKKEGYESILPDSSQSNDVAESIEEVKVSSVILTADGLPSANDEIVEEPSPTDAIENKEEAKLSGELVAQDWGSETVEVTEKAPDDLIAKDDEQSQEPNSSEASASEGESALSEEPPVMDATFNQKEFELSGEIADQTLSSEIAEQVTEEAAADVIAEEEDQSQKPDSEVPFAEQESQIRGDVIENQDDIVDNVAVSDVQAQTSAAGSENSLITSVEEEEGGTHLQKNGNVPNPTGESAIASPKETTTKVAIAPAIVKQLREETGAGMMDCKKALSETEGDIVKAQEYLRKKGLASADKKSSRVTAEGRIGSYIHDSRIGILVEVNCETDFVARGDIFKELVEDLAMQVAACPQVQYLSTEDVPKDIVNKEKEIEMQKEDLLSKPEQIRSKIVDGRINKRLQELALLEQPYIKNDKIVVKDWVKQTIAKVGENIKVKRFVRYNLGEGLERKSLDFAAEVAAQTAAKLVPTSGKQEPPAIEAKETIEKTPKATISAALVKQLREETGAGMMDCKKALSETAGDLEKAQEYLRKKGLSAADKKSKRLAAEGRIGSYIHDSRIGVLLEVNCETDFVGRSENFKELVDDLAMQVVACPQVQYVSIENVPESMVDKEKELEMQREDLLSKPENIREKIVEGRVSKRLSELTLLEQPFIRNDSILVKDLVKQTVASLGENIKVRRFIRFTLGETSNAELGNEAGDAK
ncbi:Mitochondrial translation elongation factor EF-Tsmt, catalyzes nucleotide exchange on EF-Tumt [Olea europaea subsp. europaea]|uniref:Elongation factor Ts, mitochondrial n=1 Tax=Olea europaea subsp. europaea TaxID=158383 RepID=A0A8S0PHS7_OLEEU|nr:Mitochondrial translation elongation factor EF-Tsmt, catalyzes nucleotide exchange on EF-Tumt [Olea europaea subsp. europaea]